MKTSAEWCREITDCWQQQLASIFRTGKMLHEAKEAIDHGEWLAMLKDGLPFKARTAQRLMKIAADVRLTNPAHAPHLPTCWSTLYALTHLSDERFSYALEHGAIHPEMQRADAVFLLKGEHDAKRDPLKSARLVTKRNAYLEECRTLDDVERQSEIVTITKALAKTPMDALRERRDRQTSADGQTIRLAKAIVGIKGKRKAI
jgi:hypothetical protein